MPDAVWGLEPGVCFLNHGSFGACPLPVLEAQTELRRRMEAEPVKFLDRELEGLLDEARSALGRFVGADPADLAFVPNATAGVNTVVRSLRFEPGEVPVFSWPSPEKKILRISAQLYNSLAQYRQLAEVLGDDARRLC